MTALSPRRIAGRLRIGGLLRQPAVLLAVIAPVIAYRVLTGRGMPEIDALAVAAVFPAAGALRSFARERRLDVLSALALTAIAVGLAAGLLFHEGRILLVKESITSGVLGLACLGSLFVGRPLIFGLRRNLFLGADAAAQAEFEHGWREPGVRAEARRTTAVWGFALLTEAAVRVALSYVLSTATMVTVSPLIAVVVLGPLGIATLRPPRGRRADRLPFPPSAELFVPPPRYRELQEAAAANPVTTSVGDPAWLVTRHADVAALLGDDRLGRSHPDPGRAARVSSSVLLGGPVGDHATERDRHRAMRRLLGPAFSPRRISLLRPRVAQIVDQLLDALPAPPTDWHQAFSVPLPVFVICELLGVSPDDRHLFRGWAQAMTDLTSPDRAASARRELTAYTHDLITLKRGEPGEDVISDLLAAQDEYALSDQDIAGTVAMLLFAGHETTVVRLDLGLVLLLTHREHFAALRTDPAAVPGIVEEILRLSSLSSAVGGLPRYAREEIRLGSTAIASGDAVILAPHAANRDPRVFPEPDVFDPARAPNPHLAFGHGSHYCVGASLARLELTEAFVRIAARLPELRLAVPVSTLRLRDDHLTGGLSELAVTW